MIDFLLLWCGNWSVSSNQLILCTVHPKMKRKPHHETFTAPHSLGSVLALLPHVICGSVAAFAPPTPPFVFGQTNQTIASVASHICVEMKPQDPHLLDG